MATTETLQVILDARDMLTQKVKQVNQALRETGTTANASSTVATSGTNRIANAYQSAANRIRSIWQGVTNTIKNSSTAQTISESSIAQPFLNAAEKIKSRWQTMMQTIKGKIRPDVDTSGLTPAQQQFQTLKKSIEEINAKAVKPRFELASAVDADGKIKVIVKDLEKLKSTSFTIDGSQANNALSQVQNNLTRVQLGLENSGRKTTSFVMALNSVHPALGQIGAKGVSAFGTLSTKLSSVKEKVSNLANGFSGIQSAVMSAFGAVGVTSLSQFTIGAAIARNKINAVTTSITGSEAATKSLNSAITNATSGGVVGFNSVATAIQQVAIKHNLTNAQLEKTPPVLTKIGTLARAMGKDSETAQTLMSKAYDGLNGNFMLLQRNLGITKQQLLDAGWSGAADDVDGYTNALQKVLDSKPEMQEYLNSYEGQMERLKLTIGGVGRQMGEVLLPIIQSILGGFLELSKAHPWITQLVVGIGVLVGAISSLSMVILPIIQLASAFKSLRTVSDTADTMKKGAEGASTLSKAYDVLRSKIGLTQIKTALMTVWQGIQTAATYVATAAQWLWNVALNANPIGIVVLAIAAFIAILIYLYNSNEDVRNALNNLWNFLRSSFIVAWDLLKATLMGVWNFLVSTFGPVWDWLVGLFTGTGDSVNGLMEWLGQLYQKFVEVLPLIMAIFMPWTLLFNTQMQQVAIQAVMAFVQWISTLGQQIWTWLWNAIMYVVMWGVSFTLNMQMIALQAVQAFIAWISQLPGRAWAWLMVMIQYAINFGNMLRARMQQAVTNAVNAFINFLKTLPQKAWNIFNQVIQKVISFATNFINKLRECAQNAVNRFKEKLDLVRVVREELQHIADCIRNGAGAIYSAIRDMATNMINTLKSWLHMGSPGEMAHTVEAEMGYINNYIREAYAPVEKSIKGLATTMTENFNADSIRESMNLGAITGENTLKSKISEEVELNIRNRTDEERNKKLDRLESLIQSLLTLLTDNGVNNNAVIIQNMDNATGDDLLAFLREHITDKNVLKSIANSNEFQAFDNRMKRKNMYGLSRHI